jgi:hypothetical protein
MSVPKSIYKGWIVEGRINEEIDQLTAMVPSQKVEHFTFPTERQSVNPEPILSP